MTKLSLLVGTTKYKIKNYKNYSITSIENHNIKVSYTKSNRSRCLSMISLLGPAHDTWLAELAFDTQKIDQTTYNLYHQIQTRERDTHLASLKARCESHTVKPPQTDISRNNSKEVQTTEA